jgi:hypothetical protein
MKTKPDGNVAFKVTWVYGRSGPFTSPCTAEGRYWNIWLEQKVWCSQKECPCKKLFDARSGDDYDRQKYDYWPCYDAAIFSKWSFGGGVYHRGKRKDEQIPFKQYKVGKLAFFTSRRIDMTEEDRIIIGCFRIGRHMYDDDLETPVIVAADLKLRVKDFDRAPRFWDFHKQNGPPKWGAGLFRYIPDEEAKAMLDAVKWAASL